MNPSENVILSLVRDGFFRVDDDGRVWRKQAFGRTGKRRLVPEKHADELRPDGYSQVRVTVNKVDYVALSHRIVWANKNGPIPLGIEINHDNGRRSDNRPGNLLPATPSGNSLHAYEVLGRAPTRGEANGRAKLSESQVAKIRQRHAGGDIAQRALAREYGVSHTQIRQIISGKQWREMPA